MAYEGIKNFVVRRLGYPVVKVYITSEQIEDAIWEAISYYTEYNMCKTNWKYINGTSGVNEYDLPPDIIPSFIKEVVFKPGDPLLSLTGVTQDVYLMYYINNSGSTSFVTDYWLTLASYEEYTRVLGNQPHWEIINNNKLKLDPTPSINFVIGIKYKELPDENFIENNRWIRQYTLAVCKTIEGEIRSKFSSFQAGSGEVSLNGESLKAEGKQEMQELLEFNFSRQEPLGMVVGWLLLKLTLVYTNVNFPL